jgi:hypothetical protein
MREFRPVPWVESHSLSFSARHDSSQVEEAAAVLASLEVLRDELDGMFERTPGEVAVVLHPRPWALALAHPWLPLARATVLDYRPLVMDPPMSSITYQNPGEAIIPMEPGSLAHELYLRRVEASPSLRSRQLRHTQVIIILIMASIVPFVLLYRSNRFGSNLKRKDNI